MIDTTEITGAAGSNAAPDLSNQGTPDGTTDITEQKTVEGLSRTIGKQRNQIVELTQKIASLSGKPDENLAKEMDQLKSKNSRLELAIKYPDVASILDKALQGGLSPEYVDEDFVNTLRAAQGNGRAGADEPISVVAHNPQRGQLTQDQQDEQVLRGLKSLWPGQ